MYNCNDVMLALKRWMAAQPRSPDPDQPRPSPREVLFEDVEDGISDPTSAMSVVGSRNTSGFAWTTALSG